MQYEVCPNCGSKDIQEMQQDRFLCADCENQFSPDDFVDEKMEADLEEKEESGAIGTEEAGFVRGYDAARTQDRSAES